MDGFNESLTGNNLENLSGAFSLNSGKKSFTFAFLYLSGLKLAKGAVPEFS